MKTLEKIGAFILKHWRWVLLIICLIVFCEFPHKPIGPMLTGMSSIGFLWMSYSLWNYYTDKNKPK